MTVENLWAIAGSSPRMRGARSPRVGYASPARIIPADAGSTGVAVGAKALYKDHPRGCGEHRLSSMHWRIAIGSSPRMRGAQQWYNKDYRAVGIIPADAGST